MQAEQILTYSPQSNNSSRFLHKFISIDSLLYVSLILALAASLNHVAFAFSTVNGGNLLEGYISAVAVDMGLLALAAGINQRKTQGRNTGTLWGGVVFFSLISVYANWLAGIVHVQPIAADVGSIGQWLVSLRPIILSGVLPCLVIYLSEIVSGNHQQAQIEQAKEAKRQARQSKQTPNDTTSEPETDQSTPSLQTANDTRQAQKQARMQQAAELIQAGKTQSEIADEIGVSIATVKRYRKELNGSVPTGASPWRVSR